MNLQDTLAERLIAFDGRSSDVVISTRTEFGEDPAFWDAVIALCSSNTESVAGGASWLVLDHVKAGRSLGESQVSVFLNSLDSSAGWAHALHVCQAMDHVTVPLGCVEGLAAPLVDLCAHKRPFVRAWALNGLCLLARADDGLLPLASKHVAKALDDEAASVRARAKRLAGTGFAPA